jgi:hypothetical protein
MKKVRDLLLMLPDDLACKALTNFRTQRNDRFHNIEADKISSAITQAFCWSGTPEGDNFWRELYNQYEDLEFKELETYGKTTIKIENQNQET